MKSLKGTIDMDALNAITDRVLIYTPPKEGKNRKRAEDEVKYPPMMKESVRTPKSKMRWLCVFRRSRKTGRRAAKEKNTAGGETTDYYLIFREK